MMTMGILRGFSILPPLGVDVQVFKPMTRLLTSKILQCPNTLGPIFFRLAQQPGKMPEKKWCPHQLAGYTYHTPNSQSWEPVTKLAS